MTTGQIDMFDELVSDAAPRFTLTEGQLFERLVKLETDKLVLAEDLKQLKLDAKYHEDDNPKGISADEIKLIAKAASIHAKNTYEEQKDAANAVFNKYKELTNYDK